MLELVFKSFIDGVYLYDYYPNDGEEFGTVSYNIDTEEVKFLQLTSYDKPEKWYAGHAIQALQRFAQTNEFPEKRTVAWW